MAGNSHRVHAHTHTVDTVHTYPWCLGNTCTDSIQSNDSSKERWIGVNRDELRGVRSWGCSSSLTLPRFRTTSPYLHHTEAWTALSAVADLHIRMWTPIPPSLLPVAGLHYFLLRAKWDLSVCATVDWPVSKALHALKPNGSLIILFFSSISIVKGGISAGWPGCNAIGSSPELQCRF